MELSTLVKMSNTYGSNPAYVLAGGGNTSVKDDTTLYVKGSGTQLATIKAEGICQNGQSPSERDHENGISGG